MPEPPVIQTSLAPGRGVGQRHRRPSIAERVGSMGQSRIGGLLLLLATVAAIVWANAGRTVYETFWATRVAIDVGDHRLDLTLHTFVNEALMAVFFFTIGLEVRREFAIGELTSRRRAVVPVVAAIASMTIPALLFAVLARDTGNAHAWGIVISADTAFVISALALIGPRAPGRLRVFLLAVAVVDDIGALSIIALVYTDDFTLAPLVVAVAGLIGVYCTRYLRGGHGPAYVVLAVVVWLAFYASGVHPTLAGVAIALLVPVYRPDRADVEHALSLANTFRQSPNTEYARAAVTSLRESISINERLQSTYAPYVSYAVLPLFALANAGVALTREILSNAASSALTWAVIVGLVAGQLIGIFGASALLHRWQLGEFGPGLTLDRVLGGAALCGIGFTISLFIIDLAIDGDVAQNQARVGVLAASLIAFLLATIIFRISDAIHRADQESGRTLLRPVDPARDHVFGNHDAPYAILEYGDFQCGFCLRATGSILELHEALGDEVCYVWRHAPITQIHPDALATAEASEAAALQGSFFDFARAIFDDQENQQHADILRVVDLLGLDVEQFEKDRVSAEVTGRVRDDVLDAEAMNITAVPTLFINGCRHDGPYDAQALLRALRATAQSPSAADSVD